MNKFFSVLAAIFCIGFCLSCDDGSEDPSSKLAITSFSPAKGLPGSEVVITGTAFGPTTGDNTVTLGGKTATVLEASETQLKVVVPEGATTGRITVKVGGETKSSTSDFIVQHMPEFISYSKVGSIGGNIYIDTKYLGTTLDANIVKVNGVLAEVVNISNYTTVGDPTPKQQLTVKVPVVESGKISITYDGLEIVSDEDVVLTAHVIDFTPKAGVKGTTVTITGLNFSEVLAENSVVIGDQVATVVSATKTEIKATVGAGAAGTSAIGSVIVDGSYANDIFMGTATSWATPASGPVGTWVNVWFTSVPAPASVVVKFNGVAATEIDVTEGIRAKVPAGATTGAVTIHYNGFTSVSPNTFTVE